MNDRFRFSANPFLWVVFLLIICWVTTPLGVLSLLIPVALVIGVVSSVRNKAWLALPILLLLNPLTLFFGRGVADYLKGAPTIRFKGLPDIEDYNLDRTSRCFPMGEGCVMHGNEWVSIDPHNAAVEMMSHLFGPPSKSYNGPYPTKDEAIRLTEMAPSTPIDQFLKGQIIAGGKVVSLNKEMIEQLISRLRCFYLKDSEIDVVKPRVRAVIEQERCLILRLSGADIFSDKHGDPEVGVMIFFDTKNQRPFAYFNLGDRNLPRIPPFFYAPEFDW